MYFPFPFLLAAAKSPLFQSTDNLYPHYSGIKGRIQKILISCGYQHFCGALEIFLPGIVHCAPVFLLIFYLLCNCDHVAFVC